MNQEIHYKAILCFPFGEGAEKDMVYAEAALNATYGEQNIIHEKGGNCLTVTIKTEVQAVLSRKNILMEMSDTLYRLLPCLEFLQLVELKEEAQIYGNE